MPTSTLASRLFLRTAFGPGPFRLFALPTPGSKNWRSIDDLAELEARERVVVHAHLSRLGRLRKICSDHNHPFLSPNTSAGKARRDKLLLAQINPPLVRRGRLYSGEADERHRRLLRTQRAAYTSSRARIPPLVKRVAVSPVMSGSNRLMHSIINPAPAYPVIPTG